jgi:hypothetical protein
MVTVLEEYTTEGQRSLDAKDIHKEIFADDEGVEMKMREWLRQQSKDFCAAGSDALVKRWDMCTNVGA